ncbi:MAG: DUF4136 domain-containing protein [Flavobacteriaceae bacterium]|jgi:hypothetical protein|nr:DUF4136 domain-containing protein [Flavobacteriaceae bacterium]
MKNKYFKIFALSIVTLVLNSCYPDGDVNLEDLDTVSTFYTENDFNPAPSSAIIYWDVAQLKGDDGDDIAYNGEIDDEILNTTLDNLVSLYGASNVFIYSKSETPFPTPNNASVTVITSNDPAPQVEAGIVPSIVLRKNTQASIIYPPCLPGFWYWYCYPPVVGVSSYSVGTVLLELTDLRSGGTSASWNAIIRGLLSSSSSSNSSRTIEGVNQAFNQSPYLK